jgi:hypothetical protein
MTTTNHAAIFALTHLKRSTDPAVRAAVAAAIDSAATNYPIPTDWAAYARTNRRLANPNHTVHDPNHPFSHSGR